MKAIDKTHWVVIFLKILVFTSILSGCSSNDKKLKKYNPYELFSKEFRINWKTDSIGKVGFREKYVAFDSVSRTCLINGISIIGFSYCEINAIFGKPTNIGKGKEDDLLMTFYVTKREQKQIDSKAIQILFDKYNLVDDILVNEGF